MTGGAFFIAAAGKVREAAEDITRSIARSIVAYRAGQRDEAGYREDHFVAIEQACQQLAGQRREHQQEEREKADAGCKVGARRPAMRDAVPGRYAFSEA